MKTPSEWLDLLHKSQDGFASCMFVYREILKEQNEIEQKIALELIPLCHELEAFPESEQQTTLAVKLGDLVHKLQWGINGEKYHAT
jgi:hypothetical protein